MDDKKLKRKYRKRQRKSKYTLATEALARETRSLARAIGKIGETYLRTKEMLKSIDDLAVVILESNKSLQKSMDGMKRSHESLDETVCNVLLAIRQNEYLQAWYPASKGHSEMKVIGQHPANIV
jgi:hypothetical protein